MPPEVRGEWFDLLFSDDAPEDLNDGIIIWEGLTYKYAEEHQA